MLRDHSPITFDKFNGLWDRGDKDSTPIDHFQDCNNIKYIGSNSFGTRDGVGISQDIAVPLSNIKRIYNYPTPTGNTLIVLTYDVFTNQGQIHHVIDSTTVYGPILTLTNMTDFGFLPYAGRGYISPFTSYTTGDLTIEKGLPGQVLYVYMGNGAAARAAGGDPLVGNLTIANGAAGHTDGGFHLFAFVAETNSGFLTAPGAITGFTTSPNNSVSIGTVPTSGDPTIVKRHLVATKIIDNYDGNTTGYQFFFVPNATINNDTDTFLNNISFFDADLLDDASHLLDNYASIPAGVGMCLYHNRLCIWTFYDDISLMLVSAPGEPEAISQVDGLIALPPDSNPITNATELRDILYITKRAYTTSYPDNGDVPSTWLPSIIDRALGTCVHGMATVLDSGQTSVDFIIICTYQGISLFNGKYITPELSWKIENFWKNLDRNAFGHIQIINAPIQKELYIVIPDGRVLVGNYGNGMEMKTMRWVPWSFQVRINTIAIHNIDEIVLGADLP